MSLPSFEEQNLEEMISKSKAVYTLRDKLSGKTYGYALMLTDTIISLDQAQLLPCQAPGGKVYEDDQSDRNGALLESRDLTPRSLASNLDISEDSSLNNTVEDGLSVSGQGAREVSEENMDVVISRGDVENNENAEAPNNVMDDDPKISANFSNNDLNSAPLDSFLGSSSKSLAQTIAADIASKIGVVNKDADGKIVAHKSNAVERRNVSHPSNDEDAVKTKGVKEPSKQKYDEPVNMPGLYSAFCTDAGVTQPQVKGYKHVRCLLCKDEKILARSNFNKHIRAVHEPRVKCDICEKEISSQEIRKHKKICAKRRDKELPTQELRLSGNRSKLEREKAEFILVSAMRPEINVKVVLRRNAQIRRAMKKFGKECRVSRKNLNFVLGGVKLTGGELVNELEGRNIIVHGKIN